jgi:hypothetical protein
LKEYKYASKDESFQSLPYFMYHINPITSETILNQITQAATISGHFALNIESDNFFRISYN